MLRWAVWRRVKQKTKELKGWGINPHVGEEHVEIVLGRSETDELSGKIKIGMADALTGSTRHELTHRAHILRVYAPTSRARKENAGKYMERIPEEFEAISETLATLAGLKLWNIASIEKTTMDVYRWANVERDKNTAKAVRSTRNHVLEMWNTLRKVGLSRNEAKKAILHALYNSKTLTDLEIYRDSMAHYGELRKTGIETNPSEVIAMVGLARLKDNSVGETKRTQGVRMQKR